MFDRMLTHLEKHRVRNAALESMVWIFKVVQRINKSCILPVDGALSAPKLAKVVGDVLEKDPNHEHSKQGWQHNVDTHQLAQKSAKKFDTQSTWIRRFCRSTQNWDFPIKHSSCFKQKARLE